MKVLVTGGGGFLGKAIVRLLLDQGHSVRSFSRGDYPELRELGVETLNGDLKDYMPVDEAMSDCDAVIHCGAKAGASMDYDSYFQANVLGTLNVLDACRRCEVTKLVYTSSPSVTFAGRDQEGVDESVPYPRKFNSHYSRTKSIAEQMVLDANSEILSTVALRPHLIWGPGDTQLVPRIIERAKSEKLAIVGSGSQKVDATYIDNAARAHVLALEKLSPEAACSGKAYYISNGEPMAIREILDGILGAAGLPPVTKKVPLWAARLVGAGMEVSYKLKGRTDEPAMTRFIAQQLGTAHWYDISAAERDLGYTATVSMEEGFRRLAESLGSTEEAQTEVA